MSAVALPERARTRPPLRQQTGPAYTRIHGIGDYRPERIVTNDEICAHLDSSDAWIRERSGIVTRRQARDDESVVDMAAAAARAAMVHAGIDAGEVGAVVVATVTHPYETPAAAPLVAHLLGCDGAAAIDVAAACAGYTYGIALADDMIRCGRARFVVVGGAEKMSDFRNTSDRSTAFIFGDGAGAAVVGPSDAPGISATVWGADGSGSDLIRQSVDWATLRQEAHDACVSPDAWPFVTMEGPSVFRWATCQMVPVAKQALEVAGITVDDLDVFIPHQANTRIIDAMVKKLGLPERVVVARDDIADMANTSAASVPLATARLLREGRANSGDVALQIGFGAGLAWAAQVVVLP